MAKRLPPEDPEGFLEDWTLLRDVRRSSEKIYVGRRTKTGQCRVAIVDGNQKPRALPLSRNVLNHSQGFEWGYGGSGPAQLALAILLDYLEGDAEKAVKYHQDFKFMVVGGLPKEGWALPVSLVKEALERIENRADTKT